MEPNALALIVWSLHVRTYGVLQQKTRISLRWPHCLQECWCLQRSRRLAVWWPQAGKYEPGQRSATGNIDGYFLSVMLNAVLFPEYCYILSKSKKRALIMQPIATKVLWSVKATFLMACMDKESQSSWFTGRLHRLIWCDIAQPSRCWLSSV